MNISAMYRWTVLTTAATLILSGCGGGSSAVGVHPIPKPTSSSPVYQQGADWVTYAHDEARTSTASGTIGINHQTVGNLQLLWTYKTSAEFQASPIVVGANVYAVDKNGLVVSLDAASGTVRWTFQLPDSDQTKMTPALYDNILFVGTQQNDVQDKNYHIIALDPQTGHQLWSQPVPGGVHGSPVVIGGMLFVPVSVGDSPYCRPGGVYSFNEQTGIPISSWLTSPGDTSDGGGIWSSLTYTGGSIFFGSGNTCVFSSSSANAVVSLNLALTESWHVSTAPPLSDDDVGGTVAVYNGIAYAMGKNGNFYAMNTQTGQLQWSKYLGAPDGAGGFSTPSLAAQTLIVGGGYIHDPDHWNGPPGGNLFGLSLQGSVKWRIQMNTANLGSAAIANDVAITTIDQSIAALDPASGSIVWQYPTVGYFYGSPVVVPSGLFVADESGRLYAFGLPANGAKVQRSVMSRAQILGLQPSQRGAFHRRPVFCAINKS